MYSPTKISSVIEEAFSVDDMATQFVLVPSLDGTAP
jgi:hypothetical protein